MKLILFFIIVFVTACGSKEKQVAKKVDPNTPKQCLVQTKTDKTLGDSATRLGNDRLERGQYSEAMKFYRKAMNADCRNYESRMNWVVTVIKWAQLENKNFNDLGRIIRRDIQYPSADPSYPATIMGPNYYLPEKYVTDRDRLFDPLKQAHGIDPQRALNEFHTDKRLRPLIDKFDVYFWNSEFSNAYKEFLQQKRQENVEFDVSQLPLKFSYPGSYLIKDEDNKFSFYEVETVGRDAGSGSKFHFAVNRLSGKSYRRPQQKSYIDESVVRPNKLKYKFAGSQRNILEYPTHGPECSMGWYHLVELFKGGQVYTLEFEQVASGYAMGCCGGNTDKCSANKAKFKEEFAAQRNKVLDSFKWK